jgi:uncharacterized protein YbjT (DUF2867 family)
MKVVVAGGTGLVGTFLLDNLKSDASILEVIALTRREKKQEGKVKWVTADFVSVDRLSEVCSGASAAFCCLGTTIKKAGSQEAFRAVDHDYVVNFGKASHAAGVNTFSVVSAIGSDVTSKVFYNRVKGEMERDLEQIGFDTLNIFHPSILLGPREEFRLGEKRGIVGMTIASPLLFGSLSKYKPIHVKTVAKSMLLESKEPESGIHHFEYDQMTQ